MRVSDFDFDLPGAFIAQHPAQPRDSARLLVVGKNKTEDLSIIDLAGLVAPGDVLVVNDTRVFPCALKGGGKTLLMKMVITTAPASR